MSVTPKYSGVIFESRGIWQMRIYWYENGTRKQKGKSTKLSVKGNKRQAQQILNKTLDDLNSRRKELIEAKNILFTDFMYEWLISMKNSIEINTYESYEDVFNRYIKPYFSERQITLSEMEAIQIQHFYNERIESGLNPNTVLKIHANIRKALQHAMKMDMIPYNIADRVTLPKKQKYHANFYNEEQLGKLLTLIKAEPMYPMVLLTAFWGLRRSEALGLKWSSVDFDNSTVIIKDTVVCYKTIEDKSRTKTKASCRTLPLTAEMSEYLKKLKKKQLENKVFWGAAYTDNDYVFKRDNGEPFKPNYITERFIVLIKKYNLPKIRFHDLRHSAASNLLANGFSLKEIGEYLGHGDIATTANIYAHVQYQAKKEMAESMGKSLKLIS